MVDFAKRMAYENRRQSRFFRRFPESDFSDYRCLKSKHIWRKSDILLAKEKERESGKRIGG